MDEKRIGPYAIERELGAGGMGTVYLARELASGRHVALKVLPAALSREPGFVARFHREIEVLQKVRSPHIVELYESGVEGETYYYAMEYVPGETLTARLERDKRLPWREVIAIGAQICRALKAAHNAGVIHRDLKPSNLILSPQGAIKLADFGVAQMFAGGKLTATGGMIGTAEYMSPEQAEGKRATKQSDIYALGAVMYTMLTGRPPFTGKTVLDIAQKHRFGQFDSPRRFDSEIPHWLDEVVCKCLAKDPAERYPDAYVLSLRLEEIPRKVALAASESLPAGDVDQTAETAAANSPQSPRAAGELGGTFVRDMVKIELEREVQRTRLQHWLDNTWVLVGLLAAVIASGVWFYQQRLEAPAALFERGTKLMQSPEHADWLRAQQECFQPLLQIDRQTWGPQIAPFQTQLDLAQKEAEVLRALRRRGTATGEPSESQRVLELVANDVAAGRPQAARQRLEAWLTVLPQDERHAVELQIINRLLEHLPESPSTDQNHVLSEALVRLEQAVENERWSEVDRLCSSILLLYRDDPTAAAAIRWVEAVQRTRPIRPIPHHETDGPDAIHSDRPRLPEAGDPVP